MLNGRKKRQLRKRTKLVKIRIKLSDGHLEGATPYSVFTKDKVFLED